MPDSTEVVTKCWQVGDNVNGDAIWDYVTNKSTGNSGYAADYYLSTNDTKGNESKELSAQGIPECGVNGVSKSYDQSGYNGQAAASWALQHATDPQKYSLDQCTWFVSQSLWAGGLRQTPEWNGSASYGHPHIPGTSLGSGAPGTPDAWLAPKLINYIERTYPDSTWQELDFSQNNQPNVKAGDVAAYDWDGDGTIDHLGLSVGDAPGTQYPEFAEQGNVEALGDSSSSQKQGWTWSRFYGDWIKTAKTKDGIKAYADPHAYLLHIVANNY